jgi:hypothetical protein
LFELFLFDELTAKIQYNQSLTADTMRKIKLSDITQPKVYKIFKLKIFLFLLIAAILQPFQRFLTIKEIR